MTLGIAFWILMLLWLVLGAYPFWNKSSPAPVNWGLAGGGIVLFILLVLLGWHSFGPPIHG